MGNLVLPIPDGPIWRDIAANVPEALFRTTPSGRLLAANPALARLLGYATPHALIAACADVSKALYARAEQRAEFLARMESGGAVRNFEADYRRADGSVARFSVSAVAALDAGLRIVHYDGCVRDVSELLARHERHFYDLVESSSDIILVLDEALHYAYFSRSLYEVLGYWPEELLGKQALSLAHAEDAARGRAALEGALRDRGRPHAFEFRARHRNGAWRHIQARGRASLDQSGHRILIINARDVTEQRRAEERLHMAALVIDNSPTLAYVSPPNLQAPPDYISENIRRWGYSAGELLSGAVSYARIVHAEDRARLTTALRERLAGRDEAFALEYRIVTRAGETRWVEDQIRIERDADGRALRWQGIMVDVTERKRSEERLRQLNRTQRALSACNQAVVRAGDEAELLDEVCRDIVNEGGFRFAWVGFVCERAGANRVAPVAHYGVEEGFLDDVRISAGQDVYGRGSVGAALRGAGAQVVNDLLNDPRTAPWRGAAAARGYRSKVALALVDGEGRAFGVLSVYAAEAGAFDLETTDLLVEIAADLAMGIEARRTRLARVRAEAELAKAEMRLRSIIEGAAEPLLLLDADGRVEYANPASATLFGRSLTEMAGKTLGLPLVTDAPAQYAVLRPNKELRTTELRMVPIEHEGRRAYVVSLHDLTDRLNYEARIAYLAQHDGVTGLPNRSVLRDRLAQAVGIAGRAGGTGAILLLNLQGFKRINEGLGHEFGDRVLVEVGRRLLAAMRRDDTVARLGGDHFIVLLAHLPRPQDAARAARKALAALSEPLSIEGHELPLSASVGVSVFPGDGDDLDVLLANAEAAMQDERRDPGTGFRFFRPELSRQARTRFELEGELRQALRADALELHFQPEVEVAGRRVIGAEALLRWEHPKLGRVPPARFVPIAEETGLIVPIGEWALRRACTEARAWSKAGGAPIRVAVNLSARQFWGGTIADVVGRVLRETGLEPERLELEVTESVVLRDVTQTTQALVELRRMGVSVAIDDFGTGYSSLSYLRKLPVDRLKIDQSFVRDMAAEPTAAVLVGGIVHLARALGIRVIAEGVETERELELLREAGCEAVQGYLFSPALPPREFAALVSAGGAMTLKTEQKT